MWALWANCGVCITAVAGLASILVMLTADPSEQPAQSLACKRMSKAACNWVELMTGMMLWQHRKLPFMDLPAEASVARMLAQQPRNTDREFHDFFTQVRPPTQTCKYDTSVSPAIGDFVEAWQCVLLGARVKLETASIFARVSNSV